MSFRSLFAFGIACAIPALASAAEPSPPKGFKAIFNGADLVGWHGWAIHDKGASPPEMAKAKPEDNAKLVEKYTEDAKKHWSAKDGELINDGKGAYLATDKEYGDYELLIDYKTVAKADSGIYLKTGPQVQIWDFTDKDKFGIGADKGSGGLWNNSAGAAGKDPLVLADKPLGEWNSFKIRQIGERTTIHLNGKLVVDHARMENYWNRKIPLPAKGKILLQTHGGEIRWRNIFVRDVPAAEAKRITAQPELPSPTEYDVTYGPHPKQVLHFWKAESDKPTPVLLFIHGGSWGAGGRLSGLTNMLPEMLKQGVSVVSVEYRFINEATADGVVPPVKGPLHDAARALQLVRSKAREWNIDKERIGASGGSAGACTSLWLAFHDDLADPKSEDLIARESSRLNFAAVSGAQTTLDPAQMKEWTPNSRYGGHAFGFTGDAATKLSQFDEFLAKRETILPWIAEYSPYALVTSDDPAIYLHYGTPPALGKDEKDPTHTSNFGVKLQEQCKASGVACELFYPGAPDTKHASVQEYLLERLKAPSPKN